MRYLKSEEIDNMRANSVDFVTPQFRVLSDGQIEQIFLAGLELLSDPGTVVPGQQARECFAYE